MHLLLVVQLHLLQKLLLGDVMVTGTQELLITEIASDTACTVIAFDRQTAPATASGAAYTLNEKPTALGSDANTDNTLVFGVDNTEILRGSDNITSVAVNAEGTQYLEVPSVTIAARLRGLSLRLL